MTTQKYSLKRTLLVETSALQSFERTLASSVTTSFDDGYATRYVLDHGECFTILEIHIDEPTSSVAWVNSLHTTNRQGIPDAQCYRKGYASEMMTRLVDAADQHGITLKLIAAPPPHMKRQDPTLPDKDALARFYARHGFKTTKSNFAQVYMQRDPSLA